MCRPVTRRHANATDRRSRVTGSIQCPVTPKKLLLLQLQMSAVVQTWSTFFIAAVSFPFTSSKLFSRRPKINSNILISSFSFHSSFCYLSYPGYPTFSLPSLSTATPKRRQTEGVMTERFTSLLRPYLYHFHGTSDNVTVSQHLSPFSNVLFPPNAFTEHWRRLYAPQIQLICRQCARYEITGLLLTYSDHGQSCRMRSGSTAQCSCGHM